MNIEVINKQRRYTKDEIDVLIDYCNKAFAALFEQRYVDKALINPAFKLSVVISFVSKDAISTLNDERRGIHKVTDVLSFPMLDMNEGELNAPLCDFDYLFSPKGDRLLPLGDIVICLERAKNQSIEYGHSFQREVVFLAVHSMLHLLGFDHETPNEEQNMFSKQEEIMEAIGLTRK